MAKLQTDKRAPLDVRELGHASLDDLITLLASEGLPTDDVTEKHRRFFAFSDANGSIIGYGGLERAGDDLLLRSVVTAPAHRGRGHGGDITEWLIGAATRSGVGDLYLLTTAARDFFAKFGFEPVERASVPRAIAESREFSSLCPETAIPMKRRVRAKVDVKLPQTGGCQCGKIRYAITEVPHLVHVPLHRLSAHHEQRLLIGGRAAGRRLSPHCW